MVKMKDSGYIWIGNVPENWNISKIKYHLKRKELKNPGNMKVLSVYREYGVIPKDSRDDNHNVTSEDTSKYKYVRKGDFVINKMKAWQGSMGISEYEGIVSPAYFSYEFTDKLLYGRYIHYLLRNVYKDEFRRISGGIREGQWDLPAEGFANEFIYLPAFEEQKKIADFANKVHAGEITNAAGEKFTTVVQIGIGGSDLGPRALYIALENWAKANNTSKMEAKFISNVDPDDAAAVLASVDLAHALFIVVSKSGTTLETLTNEAFVKNALVKAGLNPSKHMLAVTSETSPLAKSEDYLTAIFMDDYIGGRYSSVSGVGGAILSLAFGPEVFAQILDGAAAEDKLATNKNILENPDMLDALIGVYERNVQGYPATAVLPYSQALSRFPAHLQHAFSRIVIGKSFSSISTLNAHFSVIDR